MVDEVEVIVKRVLEKVSQGYSLVGACGVCGVDYELVVSYLRRHPEYIRAYEAAEQAAIARFEEVVMDAACGEKPSWHAAVWWLERRFPSLYGKRSTVTVDASGFESLLQRALGGARLVQDQMSLEAKASAGELLSAGEPGVQLVQSTERQIIKRCGRRKSKNTL